MNDVQWTEIFPSQLNQEQLQISAECCDASLARHKYFQKVWLGTLTTLGFRANSFIMAKAAITHRTGRFIAVLIVGIFVACYFWRGVRLRPVLMCVASSEFASFLRSYPQSDASLLLLEIHW